MITIVLLFFGLVGYALTVSVLAWRTILFESVTATVMGAVGMALLVAAYSSLAKGLEAVPMVFSLIFVGIAFSPFTVKCYVVWMFAFGAWGLGFGKVELPITFDLAEKAAHEGNLDEAIRLYRDVYTPRHPNDPVPHSRMGELLLRQGLRADAAAEFQAAARLCEDPDNALIAAFRAAELMAEPGSWLESMRPRFAASPKHRELLESRLSRTAPSGPS